MHRLPSHRLPTGPRAEGACRCKHSARPRLGTGRRGPAGVSLTHTMTRARAFCRSSGTRIVRGSAECWPIGGTVRKGNEASLHRPRSRHTPSTTAGQGPFRLPSLLSVPQAGLRKGTATRLASGCGSGTAMESRRHWTGRICTSSPPPTHAMSPPEFLEASGYVIEFMKPS